MQVRPKLDGEKRARLTVIDGWMVGWMSVCGPLIYEIQSLEIAQCVSDDPPQRAVNEATA